MIRRLWLLMLLMLTVTAVFAELRDPTQPPTAGGSSLQVTQEAMDSAPKRVDLVVNSILYSKFRRAAYVNGQIVQEGDVIDGFRVVEIHPLDVKFVSDAGNVTVSVASTVLHTQGVKDK